VNIILKHGDRVYLESWRGLFENMTAEVRTLVGYYREQGEPFSPIANQSHEKAWAEYSRAGDFTPRSEEKKDRQRAAARKLEGGQIVEIEGQEYTVKVKPRNARDLIEPIVFVRRD